MGRAELAAAVHDVSVAADNVLVKVDALKAELEAAKVPDDFTLELEELGNALGKLNKVTQ